MAKPLKTTGKKSIAKKAAVKKKPAPKNPPSMPASKGFLGVPNARQVAEPRVVIIPFSLENSVSYGHGTGNGAAAIIKASHQVELFDEEFWCEPVAEYGITTLREPVIKKNMLAALRQVEALVEGVLAAGQFPFTLGGEHSLTAGTIRPFVKRHPEIGILHFDAHADLRDGYAGEHYSHAAALRRVLDYPQVTKLVSIGIRNISQSEIAFYEENRAAGRIHMFWGKDKASWDIAAMLRPLQGLPVYLTFDIDGLDASLMPATGTPEPGGLFWEDTMAILRAAGQKLNIIGGDLVELAPQKNLHACDFLAAKLAYKIISFALLGKRGKGNTNGLKD